MISESLGTLPRRVVVLGLVLATTAGCATRSVGPESMNAVGAMLTVERFLQAANDRDLDAMSRLFGTADGPIQDETGNTFTCAFKRMGSWIGVSSRCLKRTEVELRMNAIALLLRHDDYRVLSEERVAGREHPTTRIGVLLTSGEREVPDVPFFVVRSSGGSWLIEEIGLTEITGR